MSMSKRDVGFREDRAKQVIEDGAKKVKAQDIERVLSKSEEIRSKVQRSGPLQKFFGDIQLLLSMLQDYGYGRYREIPYWSIAAIAVSLLYVINPFDIIPDWIPIIGELDDAAVVAMCLYLIQNDLIIYKEWKDQNSVCIEATNA